MDEHHFSVRSYDRARQVRIFGSIFIGGLAIAIGLLSIVASDAWTSRFEQVFEPLPGLLYAPPAQDIALTTEDNPVPLTFQAIDRSDAYRYNASIPVSKEPLEAAAPFVLPSSLSRTERDRALNCLTQAIYYEAGSEPGPGQRAVAQVILNRMRHPAFPSSVCGVVYSGSQRVTGCQFTFTCDGSLSRTPSVAGWRRARLVAQAALSGYVETSVGQATHYHALYVAPYWSPSLVKVANIGAHTFYRWKGWNGKRAAFTSPYAGREPIVRGRTATDVAEELTASSLAESGAQPMELPVAPPIAPTRPTTVVIPEAPVVTPSSAPETPMAPTASPPRSVQATAPPPAEAVTTTPGNDRPRRRVARPTW
ncbi:cell wall hydrolase [Brevundimonas nasdae]|uniref:cell wall hydrolase n=1 Tax=Brevundimonas nasdae TaxID=172043 RepID=UPI00069158B9|nr:cell wall hydrolase [Brevundimonas nasdae]